jgi:superfamily II DNA or RNA helicase
MNKLSPISSQTPDTAIACCITPGGNFNLYQPGSANGDLPQGPGITRITKAFARSRGDGVLHLGAGEMATRLDPSLAFWHDFGRCFVSRVCQELDPLEKSICVQPELEKDTCRIFVESVPPMRGAEFVNGGLLNELWIEMAEALARAAQKNRSGIEGYLKRLNPVWNVVGRVCFHLAEDKRNPDFPFAFIATYAHKVSRRSRLQHLPLGRALREYSGARNRQKLLALLAPLSRVCEQSSYINELVDSGDIYHPLAWTPQEAHQFLREVAVYEKMGVVVRLPDWWSAQNRPRPMVSVSVGRRPPAKLGMDGLLDFDIALTLDGQRLTTREIKSILSGTDGLVLIKGNWVEVDREKLKAVMEQWQAVADRAGAEGIDFAEAMRMLAGADLETAGLDGGEDDPRDWSEIVAGKWLKSRLESLRSPTIRREIENNAGLSAELRPYQKIGVAWLWALRSLALGGCLADDMGLGKTIQVLAIFSLLKKKKAGGTDLLIVPASLIDNWRLEIETFAPRLRILIAHASHLATRDLKMLSEQQIQAHDVVITTYGMARRLDQIRSQHWRCLILDEAQAIKNPGSRQTRAVKTLEAEWKLALTGTPVENRLGDLWSIFDFLNPGLLGSAQRFSSFCKSIASGRRGGYGPLRRLLQPYILRRLKTDKKVITDLPDKSELTAWCGLSKRQAALYQQAVSDLATQIAELEGIKRRGVVLTFLTRFKQICNHPSQWLGDDEYDVEASGKFLRLRELCESVAARQEKMLIFTQYRELTEPLAHFLAQCFGRTGLVLHGGTPVKKRLKLVQEFQDNEQMSFFVLSLKAGGTGLNLTAASHVVHFDRWWNPAVENQATDRAFRIGQKRNVLVHKFVCRGTLEERIDALIAEKQKLSDEVLAGGTETSFTEMNDDELLRLVSLDLEGKGVNE